MSLGALTPYPVLMIGFYCVIQAISEPELLPQSPTDMHHYSWPIFSLTYSILVTVSRESSLFLMSQFQVPFYTIEARWEDNATVEHWRLPEEKMFSFVVMGGFCREVFAVAFYAKVHVFSMDDKGNSIRSSATAESFRCPLLVASSCEVSSRKCMVRVGLARSWGNPHLLEHLQA